MVEVKNINQSEFEIEVLKSEIPTLVDFWAPWCGPCKILSPIIDKISEEFVNKIKVVKINTDENSKLANEVKIRAIPTMILFQDSKEIRRFTGLMQKEELVKELNKLIS